MDKLVTAAMFPSNCRSVDWEGVTQMKKGGKRWPGGALKGTSQLRSMSFLSYYFFFIPSS